MRIEVTKVTTYTARGGNALITGLKLVSSWEGMCKLQTVQGDTLIIDGETLVKASPALMADLQAPSNDYRCTKCGTRWRLNDDSTWSLFDRKQRPGPCCDNASGFLSVIEAAAPSATALKHADAYLAADKVREQMVAERADLFVTVPETKLPDGSVVPTFEVGRYLTGRGDDGKLVITAGSKPWVDITYRDARKAAAAAGFALITERQALAIAWNIAGVAANWSEGKVGHGKLLQGIRTGAVNSAQPGAFQPTSSTEQRWLHLSNGQPICDVNGNAYTWVFDDVQGDDEGLVKDKIAANSLSLQAPHAPLDKGMGWRPDGERNWSGVALIRGGCWLSDSHAGVFCLDYGWPGDASGYVGFRCTKPGR